MEYPVINPLLQPLDPLLAPIELLVPQLMLLIFSIGMLAYQVNKISGTWGRPVFFVAVGFVTLYQFPSILFGGIIYQWLPDGIFFIAVVNFVPILCTIWLYCTRRLGVYFVHDTTGKKDDADRIISKIVAILIALMCLIFLVFFSYVPWWCTGLWCLIFDPGSTLVARELTMKLTSSTIPVRLYGLYANVVAPLLIFFVGVKIFEAISKRNLISIIFSLIFILVAIVLLLSSGIKGSLLPLMTLITIGTLSLHMSLLKRIFVLLVAGIAAMAALVAVEVLRDLPRGGGDTSYRFGHCAKQLGACEPGKELIESAKLRPAGGLGLSTARLEILNDQLRIFCGDSEKLSPIKPDGAMKPEKAISDSTIARASGFFNAIFVRFFQVPLQVATWHYLYVAEYSSPGLAGISLFKNISGDAPNISLNVYQEYGTVYSSGDKTSTSSAPTSFLLAYPAYFGVFGLVLSIFLLFVYDFVAISLVGYIGGYARLGYYGIFGISALNMMSSDFFTVMSSHGTFSALALLVLFVLMVKRIYR